MKCQACGGALEWVGPLSALTHLRCLGCGAEPAEREGEGQECETCGGDGVNLINRRCETCNGTGTVKE